MPLLAPGEGSPLQRDAARADGVGARSVQGYLTTGLGSPPQERPKSAVFANETKVKMSVEEQIDRMKRHQSGSMKEKRRSLQLLGSQQPDTPGTKAPASYKVVSPCTSTSPPAQRGLPRRGALRSLKVVKGQRGHRGPWQEAVCWSRGLSGAGVPRRCAGTAASTRWTSRTWRQRCAPTTPARSTRRPGRRSPGCARWSWSRSTTTWISTRR